MDEELEKNVGTQTTGDDTNAGEKDQQSSQNTEQKTEQNQEMQNNTENEEEKIANAFGNKSENKNEVDKSKKNTVAKTNEDGSITFKNQEELNGFINRMFAKGVESAKKTEKDGKTDKGQENIEGDDQTPQNDEKKSQNGGQEQSNPIPQMDFTADIALALIEADVNPKKARRASNLVNMNKVIVNGQLDEAKLKEEIEAVITDFPELKTTQTEEQQKGFKFGAGQQERADDNNNVIASIFGNTK